MSQPDPLKARSHDGTLSGVDPAGQRAGALSAQDTRWPALRAARAHDPATRVPFEIDGEVVGSVARRHLEALLPFAPALHLDDDRVTLRVAAPARDATLAHLNRRLRAQGLIVAWRDEVFPLPDARGTASLASIERAACRFWGTLTFGAHGTGYVADAAGRPQALWIAQRAFNKATDPGKYDNLVGGGVPAGQTPRQALIREGWEEAGLSPEQMRPAAAASVLTLHRDIPEGLQREWLFSYDLALPAGLAPRNQDGEVARFELLSASEALLLASSDAMTVDAALVTLDFALRHRLLSTADGLELEARFKVLRMATPFNDSEAGRHLG